MSIVARCGSVVLFCCLVAGGAAVAQAPTGSSGSWTDPPVRGAAGPPVKPGDAKSAESGTRKPSVPETKSAQSAGAPSAVSRVERRSASDASRSSAIRRQAQSARTVASPRYAAPIRRLAVRPRAPVARASWGARLRVAALRQREPIHHVARGRYPSYAYARPLDGPAEPPVYARRAGWGGLLGEDRAYRIAHARAAGYRVMRLRTYEFGDGERLGQLMPLYPDDAE